MAEDPALAGEQTQLQTQRVRVGMIGLACVFLMVMLATAFISLGSGGGTAEQNLAQAAATNTATPREPLADLGVVPGAPVESATPARPARR